MTPFAAPLRYLFTALLTGLLLLASAGAGAAESSGFGAVAIPQPAKPANAAACVEPVEIMRRDHMTLLMHQRDATVLEGERDGKYSLTGCMDCHNPAESAASAIRYPDPQHFCAGCHLYASVRIDCFECHADRSLGRMQQGRVDSLAGDGLLSLHSFQARRESRRGD